MSRWKEFRREPVAGEWTRKQKRGYHRVRSLLWFWECHQFQVLWVTLSTAEGGDAEKLTYHHKQLRQRIERQLGFQGLEYYHCLLYTSPSPRDRTRSRMPSSA